MPEPKVEKTKPIEWATFGLLVFTAVGGIWKTLAIERQSASIQNELKAIELEKARGESISMEGQVLSPGLFVQTGGQPVPIRPVYVNLNNTGSVPVQLKGLEFRIYCAPLGETIVRENLGRPKSDGSIVLTSEAQSNDDTSGAHVGIIDIESDKWVEITKLRQRIDFHDGVLAPGQQRMERRHLIASTGLSSVITKVEVRLETSKSVQRWYGFLSDPEFCVPGPVYSAVSVETESERIALPQNVEAAPAPAPPVISD